MIFLDNTKIVWKKTTSNFKRRDSIILWSFLTWNKIIVWLKCVVWKMLQLTRKNIYNLISWEEFNIGRICTLFLIFVLWSRKKITFDSFTITFESLKHFHKKVESLTTRLSFFSENLETKSKKLKVWSLAVLCRSEKERWYWLRPIIPCKYASCHRSSPEGRPEGYMYSVLPSRHSRNVLEGKARLSKVKGKGKWPNKSCSLSNGKIEQLWQSGKFGYHSPMALVNTLWWLFRLHFALRRRQGHHNRKIEDFTFKKHDGFTYVTFSERITKTRQTGLHEKYLVQMPKMFETRNDRCPVKIFRTYVAKRPADFWTSGPFYLTVIYNPSCTIWSRRSLTCVHTISNIMKNVISKSPLETSKHVTNHSTRKAGKKVKIK